MYPYLRVLLIAPPIVPTLASLVPVDCLSTLVVYYLDWSETANTSHVLFF